MIFQAAIFPTPFTDRFPLFQIVPQIVLPAKCSTFVLLFKWSLYTGGDSLNQAVGGLSKACDVITQPEFTTLESDSGRRLPFCLLRLSPTPQPESTPYTCSIDLTHSCYSSTCLPAYNLSLRSIFCFFLPRVLLEAPKSTSVTAHFEITTRQEKVESFSSSLSPRCGGGNN